MQRAAGSMEMTAALLRRICEEKKLYRTAHLNDKLYLHYKGFSRIQNLDAYTGLKVLWLEGNGLARIEGLTCQPHIKTLYLQENCISKMEGLAAMVSAAGYGEGGGVRWCGTRGCVASRASWAAA